MSQVYKSTTGGGAGLVNSVAGTSPIQANGVSGVPQTGAVTVSILNALADGVTKGASTYNATEFSSAAGLITSNAISTSLSGGLTGSASFNLGGTLTLGFAGGGAAIESVAVNKGGTNPVTPNGSGQISILGNFVAGNAGNNPVATDGNMSNGFTIEVQTATAQLASSSANLGLASFKSADFSVDGNGFVSFSTTGAVKTLTGNSGGAIAPVAGNINTLGTGSITIAGAGSTLTTQLTGLTNHAVLIGAGTATITNVGPTATSGQVLQSAGAAADPVFSTATYPSTTTVSQILYSSSSNTVTGLATANSATLVTTSAGVPVFSGTMTNGQMIIGSTGATPTTGTITSTGGTITVSTGAGTLNLEVVGGGFTWTDVTGATQAMSVENGYITDRGGGVVYTLPATAALGSEIIVMGKLGITTITPNANQQILMSSASGTVGVTGTIVGTNVGDCVTLVATTSGASTIYRAVSWVGNWTIN